MMTKNTQAAELGYFVTELEESPLRNYQALVKTIEDGVILPSEWVTVDAEGEPVSMVEAAIGGAQYVAFSEIHDGDCILWETDVHGMGFTQDFLENQGVEPVEYLTPEDIMMHHATANLLAGKLEERLDDPDTYHFVRSRLTTIAQNIQADPEKRALIRERIAEHAQNMRIYYEVVDAEDSSLPREWRVAKPIHFTLDDIQTIYVAAGDEVDLFRQMYPTYHGDFVVLD